MLTIYLCVVDHHDWRLVAAAIWICTLGCMVTGALWRKLGRRTTERTLWIGLAALTAAATVWSTHFLAMLAHDVRLEDGLSPLLTALSFVVAVVLMVPASVALGRARQDRRWAVPAGLSFAGAVAAMHYTGMAAYRAGAWLIWEPRFVVASLVVCGVIAICGAFLLTLSDPRLTRFGSPLTFALSIAALHFTGMSGVTISPFPTPSDGAGLGGEWLPVVTIWAVILVLAGSGAALWQDRADLRRNAREMRRARDRAEAAARAKSHFLAKVSHELRTPLNGVLGLTMALRDTPLNQDQRELVATIASSGDALIAIVDDILEAARIDAERIVLDPAPFDLRRLVDEVALLMAGQARTKELDVGAKVAAELPVLVTGDRARVRQILLNLVDNAIKFTASGRIWIDVRRGAREDAIILSVRDTGIGIPADRHTAIFAPFAQVDESTTRRFGGTGLGLTICHELAQLMGGEIEIDSRPGAGSTFRVELPLPEATEAPAPAAPPPKPVMTAERDGPAPTDPGRCHGGRSGPIRILVADDVRLNRLVVRRLLPSETFAVSEAETGRETCDMVADARARKRPFDVVLMDVSMPVMDGIAATVEIRRAQGNQDPDDVPLYVIGLTAHAAPEDEVRCREAGMDVVIFKPVRRDRLLGVLHALAGFEIGADDAPSDLPARETAAS